jgi:hypothetical protein
MNDQPRSPIKWIVLITVVLLCGVFIQNAMRGSAYTGSLPFRWSGWQDRDVVDGSGQRHLSRFDSVSLHGTATLDITIGDEPSVTLDGDPDVVKGTKIKVYGDTLVITRRPTGWFSYDRGKKLVAHVTMRRLDRLSLYGASDVTIAGADSGASRIAINGAGHVTASGRLDAVSLVINGTGDADLKAMPVGWAKVVVNGAGKVTLDVRDSLSAIVNGAGDVVYDGDPPHVSSSIHGAGSIRRNTATDI